MVVYLDILLFINIILTYLILITAQKLLKLNTKTYRLIIASVFGSFFSLALFIEYDGNLLTLLIKVVSSLTISLIAFSSKNLKAYFKQTFGVIVVSFLYSGGLILFYQLLKPPNMMIVNDVVYFEFDPIIMLAITVILYFSFTLFRKLFSEKFKSTVVLLTFRIGDTAVSCIGKIDTGCNLTEPFSGSPVILVDQSVFGTDNQEHKRVIPYSSIDRSSILYGVKSDTVVIDGITITKSVYIASADIPSDAYQAIINSDIIR